MHAAFEHSWKLLSEEEQTVFRKLSVFRGSFIREAAQQVAGALLHTLAALVDKSLLRVDMNGRYSLHELLRQYAAYQLENAGEADAARDAHCAYYAEFLRRLARDVKGVNQIRALDEIEAEIDNVRLGWRWAVEQSKEHEILQSIDSLAYFYQIRSRFHEAAETFGMAVKRFGDTENEVLGQSLMLQAWFSFFENNARIGRELLLRGEPIMRRLGFHKMMPLLFPIYIVLYRKLAVKS
jgi:predicted ATPase